MAKIRVGICGFGLAGRVFHKGLIASDDRFEIVAVQTAQKELVKADLPEARICSTIDELCSAGIDLAIIAVPNFLHFEYATKALNAGIHVVVEKPFAPQSSECLEMSELARRKSKMLTVFHNRRWDGDFLTVKSVIESGQIGEVVHYEAHFDRFKSEVGNRWKELNHAGSGVLFDLGSHLIDQALMLFGKPRRVFADIATQRAGATQSDYFHVILDFGTTRAILHAGTMVAHPGPRFLVHGTRGSFLKSGMDPQEGQLAAGSTPRTKDFGKEAAENSGLLTLINGDQRHERRIPSTPGRYQKFYESVADCIINGAKAPVDPEQATDVIKVIELGHESVKRSGWVDFV